MVINISINEWYDATLLKPWKNREVLCKFTDGHREVCHYNGMYWVDQDERRIEETVQYHITKFYIFEKDYDE